MSNTCKAAVLTKKHTIEVMDLPMPKCEEDGMIIKIEAASMFSVFFNGARLALRKPVHRLLYHTHS